MCIYCSQLTPGEKIPSSDTKNVTVFVKSIVYNHKKISAKYFETIIQYHVCITSAVTQKSGNFLDIAQKVFQGKGNHLIMDQDKLYPIWNEQPYKHVRKVSFQGKIVWRYFVPGVFNFTLFGIIYPSFSTSIRANIETYTNTMKWLYGWKMNKATSAMEGYVTVNDHTIEV